MSQRAALLISIALTVVTLLGGIGVAIRVMESDTNEASPDLAMPPSTDAAAEAVAAYESDELERLQTFNSALAASYQRIAALLDTVDTLQSQNAALREREAVYQERLAEANRRLASVGREAIAIPPGDSPAVAAGSGAADTEPIAPTSAPAAASLTADDAAVAVQRPAEPTEQAAVAAPAVVTVIPVVVAPVQPQRTVQASTVRPPAVTSAGGAGLPTPNSTVASQVSAPQTAAAVRTTAPSSQQRPASTSIRPLIPAIATQVATVVQAAQPRERREAERRTESSDGRRKSRDGDRD